MDLYFVPTGGRAPITMDVSFFDTIQEIKERIQENHNIPAHKQTLIFNNQTLRDELKIYQIESISDNSHFQLIIAGDQEIIPLSPEAPTTVEVNQESTPSMPASATDYCASRSSMENIDPYDNSNVEHGFDPLNTTPPESPSPLPSKNITLILRHSSVIDGWKIESYYNDSIRGLKENIINEVHKGLPVEKLIVCSNGVELHDHNTLHECGLLDHSEIEICFKRSPPANNNTQRIQKIPKALKELKIMVLTISCGTETIPLEMNESDNVGELRKELQKMNRWELLNLSEEGYFFKYNQVVMEETKSFQWHNVRQGDTIEIINGKIGMIEFLNL